ALKDNKLFWTLESGAEKPTMLQGMKLTHRITTKSGDEIAHAGRKVTPAILREINKSKVTDIEVDAGDLEGAYAASDIIDTTTGEVIAEANTEVTSEIISKAMEAGVAELHVF